MPPGAAKPGGSHLATTGGIEDRLSILLVLTGASPTSYVPGTFALTATVGAASVSRPVVVVP